MPSVSVPQEHSCHVEIFMRKVLFKARAALGVLYRCKATTAASSQYIIYD